MYNVALAARWRIVGHYFNLGIDTDIPLFLAERGLQQFSSPAETVLMILY